MLVIVDLIFDFLIDGVTDGVVAIATSKRRIPKLLRYISLCLIGLVSLSLIGLLIYCGFVLEDNIIKILSFVGVIIVTVYIMIIVKKAISTLKKN